MVEITAQITKEDGTPGAGITFEYELGETLNETIEAFGEDTVLSYTHRALVIAAQSAARGLIRQGKSHEEIVAYMKDWKPGVPRVGKTPDEKIKALWEKMSPDDRARLAKELKASPKAA